MAKLRMNEYPGESTSDFLVVLKAMWNGSHHNCRFERGSVNICRRKRNRFFGGAVSVLCRLGAVVSFSLRPKAALGPPGGRR